MDGQTHFNSSLQLSLGDNKKTRRARSTQMPLPFEPLAPPQGTT